ncbi:CBASS cGAMP-activated phospholipase [Solidesulfovibrio sp.]
MRIVSIDGGGIKGFLPALVLAEIEAQAGRPIGTMANLLAGTSTGAILALGLAAGVPAADMAEFYRRKGPAIFSRTWGKRVASLFGLTDEQYNNAGLRAGLVEIFGDKTLADISRAGPACVVVAYDIEARRPVFFTSWDAHRDHHRDFALVDVAMASAAAPTYFEPVPIMSQGGDRFACIDGGVAANNPALCAAVEVVKANVPTSNACLISLGTGREDKPYLLARARNWGLAGWVRPLIDIMFSATSDVTDHHCRHVLGDRYVRLQADLTESVAMDATDDRAFAVMAMHAGRIGERPEFAAALRLLQEVA